MKKIINMWQNATIETRERTVIFFITWIFSIYALISSLVTNGFDTNTAQSLAATIVTGIASISTWWNNNSFTPEAIKADEYKKILKYTVSEDVDEDDIVTEEEGLEDE